jgi:preprotein translocase subunit SecA
MIRLYQSVKGVVRRLVGTSNDRLLAEIYPIVDRVNALEPEMRRRSDSEVRELTDQFRARLAGPKSWDEKERILEEILPDAFAAVREAGRRVMKCPAPDSPYPMMRHFDVQLVGGVALHRGMIAEMVTGEGKTLVATLAAYLNSLTGAGVHIVTVNDFLARRDCEWMRPVYGFLGVTAGAIWAFQPHPEKRVAYECGITFGTNSEFGFDYLRDNMRYSVDEQVQIGRRVLNYAIVDEVDSILIDEARTPLILSGAATKSSQKYYLADRIARRLKKEEDYEVKEKEHNCLLSDSGIEKVERELGVGSLYEERNMEWPHLIETALKARELYRKDREYIAKDGEIVIVDEFTGRLMEGRVWSDGLHQAVTAKEGLKIKEETQTLGTITLQNLFRLYRKLAGMTGTAMTEAAEFDKIYRLGVLAIPTNMPLIRRNHPDVIFRTEPEKYGAIVDEIVETHRAGRPVLVGTTSIEKSDTISESLRRKGIPHEVLNAKPELAAKEAQIVAQAGQSGAVTIATNMAGRGTDIVLGPRVAERGGLHVVGTERHEARRIDNQLRGRAGRQGDPGSSRFFLSFEDDLIRIFAPESMTRWLKRLGMEEGMAIESRMATRWIEKAQRRVEEYNFEVRKSVLDYDEVMDEQRKSIYSWRQKIVENREVDKEIRSLLEETVRDGVDLYCPSPHERDIEGLEAWFQRRFGRSLLVGKEHSENTEALEEFLIGQGLEAYDEKCEQVGADNLLLFARYVLLDTIDAQWKDHLHAMDVLRSGIGLRGYGQVDPKIEYKREALDMFDELIGRVTDKVTDLLFQVQIQEGAEREHADIWQVEQALHEEFDLKERTKQEEAIENQEAAGAKVEPIRVAPKVGRNEPCPCGSGLKYKKCCGRQG